MKNLPIATTTPGEPGAGQLSRGTFNTLLYFRPGGWDVGAVVEEKYGGVCAPVFASVG
jgi:hypothetical protein